VYPENTAYGEFVTTKPDWKERRKGFKQMIEARMKVNCSGAWVRIVLAILGSAESSCDEGAKCQRRGATTGMTLNTISF
jgi:hypothetical protein